MDNAVHLILHTTCFQAPPWPSFNEVFKKFRDYCGQLLDDAERDIQLCIEAADRETAV
jgi:hypothetical protein